MSFSINFDPQQSRVTRSRVAAFVQGGWPAEGGGYVSGWSNQFGVDTFYDRTSFTLMLMPAPLEEAFITSNSGRYAKLARADFTLTDSSNWNDQANTDGMTFMNYKGTTFPAEGVTTATFGPNRGMYLGWFQHGSGSGGKAIAVECGWNSTADGATGPSFRFYADGSVEAWKEGVKRGDYTLAGSGDQAPQNQSGQYIGVVMIPGRQREWIVISTTGASFVHFDDTLDPDDPSPEIAEDTKFWFSFPSMKPVVLVAPIQYPTSGWRSSRLVGLAEDPTGMAHIDAIYWDESRASSGEMVSITLAAAADPTTDWAYVEGPGLIPLQARLRFDLTGGGNYTPFVYAGLRDFAAETENTPDDPTNVIDYTMAATLDVPESPSNVSLRLVLRDPIAIDTAGAIYSRYQSNRPVTLETPAVIIDGRAGPPSYGIAPWTEAELMEFEVRDSWKGLEHARFKDPLPLDNFSIKAALLQVLKAAGIAEAQTDIYDDAYTLERAQSPSTGEWATIIRPEEDSTAATWITRLMENFAGSWFYGFKPTADGVKFFAKPPAQLTGTAFTVYGSIADAVAAGFTLHPERHVYRHVQIQQVEPEANEIRVTGWDSLARRPFQVIKADETSQDPTVAVADRLYNWLGDRVEVGYFVPEIGTEAAATRMIDELFPRLCQPRRLIQWESAWQLNESGVPAWRGDRCHLVGIGYVRIWTFSVSLIKTPEDTEDHFQEMPTIYTGEIIEAE